MALRVAIALLVLIPLLGAGPVHADRPLDTEDTATVPRGEGEVELGVDHARAGNESRSAVRVVVAAGVSSSVEVRVESAFVAVDPIHGASHAGAGDTLFGVKYRLRDESDAAPAVLAALAVRVPTGDDDRGLGSPGADVTMLAVVGKRWGALTLHGNAGYTIVTHDRDADAWRLAASGQWTATERWTAVAEVVSDIGAKEADTIAVARAGARFDASERVAIDGAVGAGLTPSSPDIVITLGVTLKF
jgi:Putative MetA-pathway of phenol degradation